MLLTFSLIFVYTHSFIAREAKENERLRTARRISRIFADMNICLKRREFEREEQAGRHHYDGYALINNGNQLNNGTLEISKKEAEKSVANMNGSHRMDTQRRDVCQTSRE